jgi:hypothetical protein
MVELVGAPLVEQYVGEAVVRIQSVVISDSKPNGFNARVVALITNAGPVAATIRFPDGLAISWNESPLGKLHGSTHTSLEVSVHRGKGCINGTFPFTIAHGANITGFIETLLIKKEFVWTISAKKLEVTPHSGKDANVIFTDIDLPEKPVTLKGFNGLEGCIIIDSFSLSADDSETAMRLGLDAHVKNFPSQIGVILPSIEFDFFDDRGVNLGHITSKLVELLPNSEKSPLKLDGYLRPQTSDPGLAAISSIFNNFIHGKDSNVTVRGTGTGSASAIWLNNGIQALKVATVLHGKEKMEFIKSIDLAKLSLIFTKDRPWIPTLSSGGSVVTLMLPPNFKFPVDIKELKLHEVAIGQNNQPSFAKMQIPQPKIPHPSETTDVVKKPFPIAFDDIPLNVYMEKQGIFSDFAATVTSGGGVEMLLEGFADAKVKTAAGLVWLKGIHFAVKPTISGLQGLATQPTSVTIISKTLNPPRITARATFYNPSKNLTFDIDDVSFELKSEGIKIGSTSPNKIVIAPGSKEYDIDVTLCGEQDFCGVGSELTINCITPIESLQKALPKIALTARVIQS